VSSHKGMSSNLLQDHSL